MTNDGTNLGLHAGYGVTPVGYLRQESHASCHEPDLELNGLGGYGEYRPLFFRTLDLAGQGLSVSVPNPCAALF